MFEEGQRVMVSEDCPDAKGLSEKNRTGVVTQPFSEKEICVKTGSGGSVTGGDERLFYCSPDQVSAA